MHGETEYSLTNHFMHLMEEPYMETNTAMEEILENIPTLVIQEKNKLLLRPIEMVEFEEAIKK